MQQRFHVAWADDFTSALAIKTKQLDIDPNTNYQIRKRATKFEVVKRLSIKDAKKQVLKSEETLFSKRHKKPKRGRRISIERGIEY